MDLSEPPRLMSPTTAVRDSWLDGERADIRTDGIPSDLFEQALADFGKVVDDRLGVRTWWDVPTTILWYISGEQYLGELVIRHELTPALSRSGGHIGYSIATPWRRQGHATRMLAAGLGHCRLIGLREVLLTCDADNEPSRRVIQANGGVLEGRVNGENRYWITVGG